MAKPSRKPFHKDLFFQVIAATILGVLVGHFLPGVGLSLKPLGDAFINLIKMMIGPIIFCTVVSGIAGMENLKQAGRVGIKALLYFEVVTVLVLLIGMAAVHIFRPGRGMVMGGADISALNALKAKVGAPTSTIDFLMNIIPHTFFSAFTDGQLLQVVLVALLFSSGLAIMGAKGKAITQSIDLFSRAVFNIIGLIVKLAPIGVFGAMAYSVSKFGVASLQNLGELMAIFFGACVFFVIFILGAIMRFYCRLSLWGFIRYIREEIMICFGTASSETVLPRMMDKLMALGCEKQVVGMVLPTGYAFNLDGTSLYLALATMFIAYATGIDLSWGQQATVLAILLVTSKGTAAIYGTAFIVLSATLSALHVFPEDKLAVALALLFSIDRIMAPGRVITNLIGNGVATIFIARWEGKLEYSQAKSILSGKKEPHLLEEKA